MPMPMAVCSSLFVLLFLISPFRAHAQSCQIFDNVIIGQNSIDTIDTSSAAECCAACNKNPACIAFTWDTASHQCFLKDNADGRTSTPQRVSGTNGRTPGWADACTQPGLKDFPFCDTTLPLATRVDDLASRILLNETGPMLTARQSIAIPRLGLPSYYWGTNAIHGLQNLNCLPSGQCPTSFPAPCALSAAFNDSLVKDMGKVLARELRAYYNSRHHNSLDTWSPTINVNRDPRWGRNVESPGEDPLVCGRYGTAYTQGLQFGDDPKYIQTVVTLKHWLAYSLEAYNNATRYNYNAIVSQYDLATTYLVPWKAAVMTGGALGVMCSYNFVNGRPTCGDVNITAILRDTFDFKGYITSDTDAIACIWQQHHFEPNAELATRDGLVGGCDINSGGTYSANIEKAVNDGTVDRAYAVQALRNSLRMRFLLGLFDPGVPSVYRNITTDVVGSAEHQEMSLRASRQGMVLLKNSDHVLPFAPGKRVAVIGTSSDTGGDLLGNYVGPICPDGTLKCVPSIYEMVVQMNAPGPVTVVADVSKVAEAVAAAQQADHVVLVASNAADGGGEGRDRYTISLAAAQMATLTAVLKVGKPTVLVLVNGGIIAIDDLAAQAPAILEAFMPGVHGAQAIAESIFGRYNPGGKMPVTLYHSDYVNQVDFLNMSMQAGPGRSYRYYTGSPIFPFGYGLSYSEFQLSWSPQPPPLGVLSTPTSSLTYTVNVTNLGPYDGDEVVLAFYKPPAALAVATAAPVPIKQLFDYQRVHLAVGASVVLQFTVTPSSLALGDQHGHTDFYPGTHHVEFTRGHGAALEAVVEAKMARPLRISTMEYQV